MIKSLSINDMFFQKKLCGSESCFYHVALQRCIKIIMALWNLGLLSISSHTEVFPGYCRTLLAQLYIKSSLPENLLAHHLTESYVSGCRVRLCTIIVSVHTATLYYNGINRYLDTTWKKKRLKQH